MKTVADVLALILIKHPKMFRGSVKNLNQTGLKLLIMKLAQYTTKANFTKVFRMVQNLELLYQSKYMSKVVNKDYTFSLLKPFIKWVKDNADEIVNAPDEYFN